MGNTSSTTATATVLSVPNVVEVKPKCQCFVLDLALKRDVNTDGIIFRDGCEFIAAFFNLEPLSSLHVEFFYQPRSKVGKLIPETLLYSNWRDDLIVLSEIIQFVEATNYKRIDIADDEQKSRNANRLFAFIHSIHSAERLCNLILGLAAPRFLRQILLVLEEENKSIVEKHGLFLRALEVRLAVLRSLHSLLQMVFGSVQNVSLSKIGLDHQTVLRCRAGINLLEGILETMTVVPGIKELSILQSFLVENQAVTVRDSEEGLCRFIVLDMARWLIEKQGQEEILYKCLKYTIEALNCGTIHCRTDVKATLFYVYGRICLLSRRVSAAIEYLDKACAMLIDPKASVVIKEIIANESSVFSGLLLGTSSFDCVGFLYHCTLMAQSVKASDESVHFAKQALIISNHVYCKKSPDELLNEGEASLMQLHIKGRDDMDDKHTSKEILLILGTSMIVGLIEQGKFEEAYGYLSLVPEFRDRQRDCLRRLVVAICEQGQAYLLGQLPFVEWLGEVERTLLHKCRDMGVEAIRLAIENPLAHPNYYKILYAFYANRNDFRSAASAIYQYVDKIRREDGSHIDEMLYSLLLVESTIALVDSANQWLAFTRDGSTATETRLLYLVDRNRLDLEIGHCKSLHLLSRHFTFKENPFDMDAVEIVELLAQICEYREAQRFAILYKLDLEPIFFSLLKELIHIYETNGLGTNGNADAIEWLDEWFEGRASLEDPFELGLLVLGECLDNCPSDKDRYYGLVLEGMIERAHESLLPGWFFANFMNLNPDRLLRIYIKSDLLSRAFEFALFGLSIKKRSPEGRISPTIVDRLLVSLEDSGRLEDAGVLRNKWDKYSRLLLNF